MLQKIKRTFAKGLLTLLPIAITIYLIVWLVRLFESAFSHVIKAIAPQLAGSGLSLVIGIVAIFLVGLLLDIWVGQRLKQMIDALLMRVPVVSDIYTAIKSLSDYLGGNDKSLQGAQVVMVTVAGVDVLGLVTRDDFAKAPKDMGSKDTVAVYLPMSYQVGGYTVYVSKKTIRPIDMSKKDALRWTLMAGVDEQ